MKLRDLEDVASLFVTHEMNNLTQLCGEYAAINEDGDLVFEPEGERLMVLVEAWRGRRILATGGFAMTPDGQTHTPD